MRLKAAAQPAGEPVPGMAPTNLVCEAVDQYVALEAAEERKVGGHWILSCKSEIDIEYDQSCISDVKRVCVIRNQ